MTIQVSQRAFEEMTATIQELEQLTSKPGTLTKKEEMRHATLLAKLSLLKSGVSVSDLKNYETDRLLKEAGLARLPEAPRTRMAADLENEYRMWLKGEPIRPSNVPKDSEVRANLAGQESITYTAKAQGGAFVPTDFWNRYQTVLKQADDIFQPWASTPLETETGSVCPLPVIDDTSNASTIIGEGAASVEVDIASFSQEQLGAYTFRSGLIPLSLELIDDSAFPLGQVIDNIVAQRHARGVSKYLVTGNGVNQPTGLLTAIVAAGVNPTIAAGSGTNDGGAETGATSIGSQDLNKCFFSINAMYRRNAIWYMNDSTLQSITSLLDKSGRPLVSIVTGCDFVSDQTKDFYFLLGKRIAVCPSMPSIGSAANPIVFGDPNFFVVRSVPSSLYMRMFKEAGGTTELILRGLIALESFVRYDSNALIPNSTQSPFGFIQAHS
jgi:HK97 family phage major capsid protein